MNKIMNRQNGSPFGGDSETDVDGTVGMIDYMSIVSC